MQLTVFKCAWCGKHLIEPTNARQTRSDKRFCNASCRGKYHRWHKNLYKQVHDLNKAISAIEPYLEHPQAREDAVEAFKQARDKIIGHLAWHGIKGIS